MIKLIKRENLNTMNIVKSGFVNGKQRYSIINEGGIIKSSYDVGKLEDYLNPPIEPICTDTSTCNNTFTLQNDEKLHIYFLSDTHFGSPEFNEEFFQYWRHKFLEDSNPKVLYLLGDLLEVASKKIGDSAFKQKFSVNEQLDYMTGQLKPMKEYIRACTNGNHSKRLKELDFDLDQELSKRLGIRYVGSQGFDDLYINGHRIIIYFKHGTGSSRYHHTSIGKMFRETDEIGADLYAMGHLHRTFAVTRPYQTIDGEKRKHYCCTGSFLSYKGYARDMGLNKIPEGFVVYEVFPNGSLNGKEYLRDSLFEDRPL